LMEKKPNQETNSINCYMDNFNSRTKTAVLSMPRKLTSKEWRKLNKEQQYRDVILVLRIPIDSAVESKKSISKLLLT
jgi:hypothetical protein